MEPELAGLECPGCGQPPVFLLGGGSQAFCGNDDCAILMRDPAKTIEELAADLKVIDLRREEGDRDG